MGFGNFGQFLAKRFVKQGHQARLRLRLACPLARAVLTAAVRATAHQVIATSRTDYASAAAAVGVRFFSDADDFVEEARAPPLRAVLLRLC